MKTIKGNKKLPSDKSGVEAEQMHSQFTATDICAIIKECGLSGVRRLSCFGIELHYGPLPQAQAIEPIHVPHTLQQAADTQARVSFQKNEQDVKDELLSNLLIEDPVEYERLLREGELIDDGPDGNDEDFE